MSGGNVIVFEAASGSDNTAFDYDGQFALTGGSIFGAGSSRMAMAPTASVSTQKYITLNSTVEQGKNIVVNDSSSNILFATKAIKNVNFVVYSSPELANGENYTITATSEAVVTPTNVPTEEPTVEPTAEPAVEPTVEPNVEPTAEPTVEPTVEPTAKPTTKPTTAPVTMEKINVKATLKTAKSQKNKVTLKWKKANGVSGYEIYRATGKNGTYKKVATVKKASKITYVDKKLKTGKKYYYKIRTYKTVNGKKVYGEYSAVKTVKIK